jgi:SAM-dependent methyltransferase
MKTEDIKQAVREGYARIAQQESSCCAPGSSCGGNGSLAENISKQIGYSEEDMNAVPEGANLGLGCGNPVAIASLKEGETVLDLGSGAGFDCFLASRQVGQSGKVIGVDMTPEMIDKARDNAQRGNYANVEFRLGEIENLPVADGSVDVILSNCVINLAPDKRRVFNEAFRVLKPGGRLMVSDIVLLKELPDFIKNSVQAYIGCLSGAILKDEYLKTVEAAGLQDVHIVDESAFSIDCMLNDPTAQAILKDLNITAEQAQTFAAQWVSSVKVSGVKPNERS